MSESNCPLRIERYYHSKAPVGVNGDLSYFNGPGGQGELTPEEQQQIDACIQNLLRQAEQASTPCRIIRPERILAFQKLIAPSVKAARDMGANLQLYIEDWSGAIFFLRRQMDILSPAKETVLELAAQAGDVYVSVSKALGTNDTIDFEGWPMLHFWFDFFECK